VEQVAEEQTVPGPDTPAETEDPEIAALVDDPQADLEVNRSLQDGAAGPSDPME